MSDERPSTAADIRGKRVKVETNPDTGNTWKYRYFESIDAFRGNWIPSVVEGERTKGEQAASEDLTEDDKVKQDLAYREIAIEQCAIEPRVTRDRKKVNDETLHISELGDEIYWLSNKILEPHLGKLEAGDGPASSSPDN